MTIDLSSFDLFGNVCDNTCIGFEKGDNTLVIYNGLPWPILTELSGAFEFKFSGSVYSLTVNGATLNFTPTDPHVHVSFNAPELSSFVPGAFKITIDGLISTVGFSGPMVDYYCPVPGVPEPSTVCMMAVGLLMIGFLKWRIKNVDRVLLRRGADMSAATAVAGLSA